MSFNNTHAPTIAEVMKKGKKARYQLPMRKGKRNATEYYMTPELEEHFRRMFPTHTNMEMITLFGIGLASVQRFKRELGLEKDMKVIRHKQAMTTKKVCEANGYYDSLRGKRPSEACREGYRRMCEEGRHPMTRMKAENPRKLKHRVRNMVDKTVALRAKDKRRRELGLPTQTHITHCDTKYTRDQTCYRSNMKKRGYILGDINDRYGERYTIYYDDETERSLHAESYAGKHRMTIKPLPKEDGSGAEIRYNNNESLNRVLLR